MQRYFFIFFLLFNCFFDLKAQSKHLLEFGISGDYFINKVKYKLNNMQHIRLPYFSFTRLVKNIYIKADYSWVNYEYSPSEPHIFRNKKAGFLLSQYLDLCNVGIAYKDLFKLKNTFFYLNIAYIDNTNAHLATGLDGAEMSSVYVIWKSLGIGVEIKQRISLGKKLYFHTNVGYNYYFNKGEQKGTIDENYVPLSWHDYVNSNFGIGYRF